MWNNRTEALFKNGVVAILTGGTNGGGRLRPSPKVLHVRNADGALRVAFCVSLFPSDDLVDGDQLYMDLSDLQRAQFFTGASGGMTFADVTNGVYDGCTVTGDSVELETEIDWMVVGSIIAVTGLILVTALIICLVTGCGKKRDLPPVIVVASGGPQDLATARTRYVREVMQPGTDHKAEVQVDLGMGLQAGTTLHTHL